MAQRTRLGCAVLLLMLAGCDRPSSTASDPMPAPVAEAAPLGDAVTQAIMGSAERSLQNRHPGAVLVFADQALSTTSQERTICGRYVIVKRHWQGRRSFIANGAEVSVVSPTTTRWKQTCDGAEPLPGALTGSAVDTAVNAAIPLAGP